MSNSLPVIFLAFANEYHEGRHLDGIGGEMTELDPILTPISNLNPDKKAEPLCELVIKPKVTLDQILGVFNDYQDRDMIFHYSGHADGFQLLLEGKDGTNQTARGEGLVPIISRRKNIKLVFLNGCSTQRLARELVRNGTMTVIGTSASIADSLAKTLSVTFYQGLAKGLTLSGAWEDAKNVVLSGDNEVTKASRGIKLYSEADRFPWDVEFRDDAAKEVFDKWNLPEEANNPLINLPELPEADLPADSPFMFLKPYEAEHAEIFFGRSYYIRDLWLKILEKSAPPLILLYGESGAGKSSLLDAGLVPRLRASGRNDDYPQFEVRYQRRDQQEGLVESLARLLEFTSAHADQESTEPAGEVPHEVDPEEEETRRKEMERLQQIESMAQELQEERTKYTLLSILERYRKVQSAPPSKQEPTGIYTTGVLAQDAGRQLRKAWRALEEKTGKPLIIILDQVEELYTDPHTQQKRELEDLLDVLKEVFSRRGAQEHGQVRGKIILGYREEFNARIEARVKGKELARSTVFLEQLNRRDIHDIFSGLQRGRAKQEYNIKVDPELPDRVANYLLTGQAAVAPVLQLLLTKLWKYAYANNSSQPHFSVAAFEAVSSKGQEMEEYFHTQMRKISAWDREAVESGLALDILHFHVSERGTSAARHIEAIKQRYRHLPEHFDYPEDYVLQLVRELRKPDVFLLNAQGQYHTTLPHDTLAPVIVAEFNRSDKFGQRSARIMETKAQELARTSEEEEGKLRLDENDLEVVQVGQKGMRALNPREQQLLERSIEEQQKRLRLRRLLIKGGIAAGLFILILSIFAASLSVSMNEQITRGVIDRANEASLLERDRHLDRSIQLAQLAYNRSDVRPLEVVKNLYELYDLDALALQTLYETPQDFSTLAANGFESTPESAVGTNQPAQPAAGILTAVNSPEASPRYLSLNTDGKIISFHYLPGFGPLAGTNQLTKYFWPGNQADPYIVYLGDQFSDLSDVAFDFTANGRHLQSRYRENEAPLYLLSGRLTYAPWLQVLTQPQDQRAEAFENLGYYDLFTGKFIDLYGLAYTLPEFQEFLGGGFEEQLEIFVREGDEGIPSVVRPADLFAFDLMDEERNLFRPEVYGKVQVKNWNINNLPPEEFISDRENIPLRPTNLSSSEKNACWIWTDEASPVNAPPTFAINEPLYYFTALDQDRLLTLDASRGLSIRYPNSTRIDTLLSTESPVVDLLISPDHRHLAVISATDTIFLWDVEGKPVQKFPHDQVQNFAFSADGNRLFSASEDQVRVYDFNLQREPVSYRREEGDYPICFARFHTDNQRLIIGQAMPRALTYWEEMRSHVFDNWDSQIVLWDPNELKLVEFEGPAGPLLDATVDPAGQLAVAIQPEEVKIIPNPEISRETEFRDQIKAVDSGAGASEKRSRFTLSPDQRYIVHQVPFEQKVELYTLDGRPANAYRFQNGFQPGFNGKLFTPDGTYLVGHRPKEILLWNPQDDQIKTWAGDFPISFQLKRHYGLETFMDYVPGDQIEGKWWAIAVVLVSFVFLLLYFSDFLFQYIQQKRFVELALYFACVFLFAFGIFLLLIMDQHEGPQKRAAFYCIALATVALASIGIKRALLRKKYSILAALSIVIIFVILGTVKFWQSQEQYHRYEADRSAKAEIQWMYRQDTATFQQLHRNLQGLAANDQSAVAKRLSPEALRAVVDAYPEQFPIDIEAEREWPTVLLNFTLLPLLIFLFLVGYPMYRALGHYQHVQARGPSFYNWLYLPITALGITTWLTLGATKIGDIPAYEISNTLNLLSLLALIPIILRQSLRYLRRKSFGVMMFIWYGLLVVPMAVSLYDVNSLFVLSLAATVILHRQYQQRGKNGMAFLAGSGSILLGTGAVAWAIDYDWSYELIISNMVLYSLLAILLFLGVRYALRKLRPQSIPPADRPDRFRIDYLLIASLAITFVLSLVQDETFTLAIPLAALASLLFFAGLGLFPILNTRESKHIAGRSPWPGRVWLILSGGLIAYASWQLFDILLDIEQPIILGLLVSAFLVLLFYGIRSQTNKMGGGGAPLRVRLAHALLALALSILTMGITGIFVIEMEPIIYTDEYDLPVSEATVPTKMDLIEQNSEGAPEDQSVSDPGSESLSEIDRDIDAPVPSLLAEEDSTATNSVSLQELIADLSAPSTDVQDRAIDQLNTRFRDHPELIDGLLLAYSEKPGLSGTVLFLLEAQSNEYLRSHRESIQAFLEEVENSNNAARITALIERLE